MSEKINKTFQEIFNRVPFPILRAAKLLYRYPRYSRALKEGRLKYAEFLGKYTHNILFVAGLPKSGTTWLENMLTGFPGYTIIPDPAITVHDYRFGGTHHYDIDPKYFNDLKNALALVKIHAHGSRHNIDLLHDAGIPYCIMYRDLRDAAVSYVYYVKRTPWHPEYPVYKQLDIKTGLYCFGQKLLPEWRDWVQGWLVNRDPEKSLVLRYEDLLKDSEMEFLKVAEFYDLPNARVKDIVERNKFTKLRGKSSFYRKGSSGDWRNHFDHQISDLYKSQISSFLIEHGYESDENW